MRWQQIDLRLNDEETRANREVDTYLCQAANKRVFERYEQRRRTYERALADDELVQAYIRVRFSLRTDAQSGKWWLEVEGWLSLWQRVKLAWICLRGPRWPHRSEEHDASN